MCDIHHPIFFMIRAIYTFGFARGVEMRSCVTPQLMTWFISHSLFSYRHISCALSKTNLLKFKPTDVHGFKCTVLRVVVKHVLDTQMSYRRLFEGAV